MQTDHWIIGELLGTRCRCGNRKRARQSFCGCCYFRISKSGQGALYRKWGSGYREAYLDALVHLASIGRIDLQDKRQAVAAARVTWPGGILGRIVIPGQQMAAAVLLEESQPDQESVRVWTLDPIACLEPGSEIPIQRHQFRPFIDDLRNPPFMQGDHDHGHEPIR